MPTTYAHWRFGDKCIETLPDDLKRIINNNRDVFNFGVHGPDIFFYYDALKHNDVNSYGTNMHNVSFAETLKKMCKEYKKMDNKEAGLAYLLGFLCHFALDSYCHGYIDRKAEVSKETNKPTSHGIIEAQFDKNLMIQDGLNPFKEKVTKTLKPTSKVCETIASFFPELDFKTVQKSLKDHKLYLSLLKDSNDAKRRFLETVMDAANTPAFKDLLLTTKKFPEIEDALMRLNKLFNKALEHYPKLVNSLLDYLDKNIPLDKYFKNAFTPKKDYKKIPILSVDAEKNYEVEIQE